MTGLFKIVGASGQLCLYVKCHQYKPTYCHKLDFEGIFPFYQSLCTFPSIHGELTLELKTLYYQCTTLSDSYQVYCDYWLLKA